MRIYKTKDIRLDTTSVAKKKKTAKVWVKYTLKVKILFK